MTGVSEEGREAVRLSPKKTPVGDPREAPRSDRGNVRSGQTGDVRGLFYGALYAGPARALREGRLSPLPRRTLENDLFAFVRSGTMCSLSCTKIGVMVASA